MPNYGIRRWHHGGSGLYHGQDQRKAGAREALP